MSFLAPSDCQQGSYACDDLPHHTQGLRIVVSGEFVSSKPHRLAVDPPPPPKSKVTEGESYIVSSPSRPAWLKDGHLERVYCLQVSGRLSMGGPVFTSFLGSIDKGVVVTRGCGVRSGWVVLGLVQGPRCPHIQNDDGHISLILGNVREKRRLLLRKSWCGPLERDVVAIRLAWVNFAAMVMVFKLSPGSIWRLGPSRDGSDKSSVHNDRDTPTRRWHGSTSTQNFIW